MTITVDEETARWARVEAARNDISVSRFVGEMLRDHMVRDRAYEAAHSSWATRAATPLRDRSQAYPSRAELHER